MSISRSGQQQHHKADQNILNLIMCVVQLDIKRQSFTAETVQLECNKR